MLTQKIQLFEDNKHSNLYTYILDPQISYNVFRKRPAIIICPGGGYLMTATKEGEAVATRFLSKGYHTFVLRYSTYFKERMTDLNEVPPINKKSHYPEPLIELMESIRLIKEHAEEWYIDTENIFVLGFSAGGHLAASLAVKWDDNYLLSRFQEEVSPSLFKPKGILLCYPGLNFESSRANFQSHANPMIQRQGEFLYSAIFGCTDPSKEQLEKVKIINHIRQDMPPVFLWHTYDDEITSSEESAEFIFELIRQKVKCEFHLFAKGKHGLGLSDEISANREDDINKEVSEWVNLADKWLKLQCSE
ncbi:alpha/beta hydrolase [Paenibacillus xylanexedens]|uniref:alpha/beta hydrolase n=1 Tax=Paenibacillus xylanexedens TaxID=528191 RepID=UPI0011A5C5C6|nr:alpha/beta hydrolase [Paenibacillus xylanexedens]